MSKKNKENSGSQADDEFPEVIVVEDGQVVSEEDKESNKMDELMKAHRYLQADFDNYRKRMMFNAQGAREQGRADVVEKLLPTIDALLEAKKVITDANTLKGLQLIFDRLNDLFNGLNVKIIDAVGKELDTNFHNVVMAKDDPKNAGKVIEIFQNGYTMGNVVLRPAQVIVGK